jgi:hypothetical protein
VCSGIDGESTHTETRRARLGLAALLAVAAATLVSVARLVDARTVEAVTARHLLPRWDLATHLGQGWVDYHLLVTGRLFRLAWDLWLQGYWPPVLSLFQVPFYLILGATIASGLRSALAAFVLAGLIGCVLLWRVSKAGASLSASVFLALLISSPYLLAYASVTMTETLGALVQLVVLLSYQWHRERQTTRSARLFAISLTLLFFTKYNYFFLLAVPLLLHEWLERTSSWTSGQRVGSLRASLRRAWSSWTVRLVVAYAIGLLVVLGTGGFDVNLFGKRISVHTIGNSGHLVLYLLLGRLWYLHHRGRIRWRHVTSIDPLVGPLLIWFVLPVTIWLASPYPNHIRDFVNLVINRPVGESSVEAGLTTYIDALRTTYFYSDWVLLAVIGSFVAACVRYRDQPPVIRWLVLAIPLQLAAIAIHQTRFPRFLLLTVVLLCLVAASEVGRWFAGQRGLRIVAPIVAVAVLTSGVLAARRVVGEQRFQEVAFENYTDNAILRAAFGEIRSELNGEDRLAIVGQSNELSPALLRWELGPPSGATCFPFEIGGAQRIDLSLATKVLLMVAVGADPAPLDETSYYAAQKRTVLEQVDRGELRIRRDILVSDRHIALRLYDRTSAPKEKGRCQ